MGVLDSSFLFLPFGNDLLIVILVAQHHKQWPIYVLSAVCGSTLGVFLLDLVARKAGEAGVQKVAGESRFNKLKKKIGQKGGRALVVGCLAPPPFPFSMVVAINSALGYPRLKLLVIVALSRGTRFVILSLLALKFGSAILHVMNTSAFKITVLVFVALCIVGSIFSVMKWLRGRGSQGAPKPTADTT